jgi:hypothetical protein
MTPNALITYEDGTATHLDLRLRQGLPVGWAELDPSGRQVAASPSMERISGAPAAVTGFAVSATRITVWPNRWIVRRPSSSTSC